MNTLSITYYYGEVLFVVETTDLILVTRDSSGVLERWRRSYRDDDSTIKWDGKSWEFVSTTYPGW